MIKPVWQSHTGFLWFFEFARRRAVIGAKAFVKLCFTGISYAHIDLIYGQTFFGYNVFGYKFRFDKKIIGYVQKV